MESDAELAVRLARGAGEVLLQLREQPTVDGAVGDRLSNEYLLEQLALHRPEDSVLSEEAADDQLRLFADRVWIIDPLDGTREFTEREESGRWRTDFAVHVALWTRADGLRCGAVALPARGQVFSSEPHAVVPRRPGDGPLRLAVSRSRPPSLVGELARRTPVEYVPMGSSGVKAMAVVTGEVAAYVHGGGQYEWDSAAPVAVAAAAGLHTSRIDGTALEYNRANPWLPDLLVARTEVAEPLLAILKGIEAV